jgi:type IV pilus assembly protein PilX
MIQKSPPRQRGAVLVVGLLLLVILTVLGTTAMQSTSLQERMAGNARDGNLASQAAEATLRDAEQYINSKVPPFEPFQSNIFNGTGGLYNSKASPGSFSLYNDLADTTKTRVFGAGTSATALPNVVAQPRYLIELLATSCMGSNESALFRITARAQGANDNTVVILQSRYRRALYCSGGGPSSVASGGYGNAAL